MIFDRLIDSPVSAKRGITLNYIPIDPFLELLDAVVVDAIAVERLWLGGLRRWDLLVLARVTT